MHPSGMPACVVPRGSPHSPRGACRNVLFFAHRQFYFPPVADRLSCSRLWSTPCGRPCTTAQVWALAEVRGTCSGVQSGKSPRGVIPSMYSHPGQCKPTYRLKECPTAHLQVKRMSDSSCDIWDLECRQCRQILLGDGKVKRMSDGSSTS